MGDTSTLGKVGQNSPSNCYCKDDTYPSYDETKLIECLNCPIGATCKRPNNTYDVRAWMTPQNGYWETPSSWNVALDKTYVKCANPTLCTQDGCIKGTTGVVCELCAKGYGKQLGACMECSTSSIAIFSVAIFFPLVVLFLIVY